jgi:phage terminase large subunit
MHNPNYTFLNDHAKTSRVIALQGGTRSGKTYSVIQWIIEQAVRYTGTTYSICRKTLPALKATAMRDFIDLVKECGYYNEQNHNKTEGTYNLNGNLIEFINLDDEMKVRGRKRNLLFVNEANEIGIEVWRQLLLRTDSVIIIDYNPSDAEHWIYDDVLTRDDCRLLVTTYKDNPFLTAEQIAEIEQYREKDPDYWRVFGEGQRGLARRGQIFTHFQKIAEMPKGRYYYGLDFGKTNDPTALVRMQYTDGTLFCEQLIYQTNLTGNEIARLMKQMNIGGHEPIYADAAEPLMIREIRNAGFNIMSAEKKSGSILAGIDKLKSLNVYVTESSRDIWREAGWYCWKTDKNGRPTNVPIDLHNHAIDAMRYANSREVMIAKPKGLRVI